MWDDDASRDAERLVADVCSRRRGVLFGRGAVALWAALRALGAEGKRVVVPSLLCLTPAAVAMLAGAEPLFVDIDEADYNIDPSALASLLRRHGDDVAAVIAPHLYGTPCRIEEIASACSAAGVRLIEDAAQALGAEAFGRPAGSWGDVSVVSFGHTKTVEAGGGGLLVCDDDGLAADARALAGSFHADPALIERLSAMYAKAYYLLQPLFSEDPLFGRLYRGFPHMFRDLYLHSYLDPTVPRRVVEGLATLDQNIEARRSNALRLRSLLDHPDIEHPVWREGCVPWRYSFQVLRHDRSEVASHVRAEGVDISTWYPPTHQMLQDEPVVLPVAERVGARIVNLWCEPGLAEEELRRSARVLLEVLRSDDR